MTGEYIPLAAKAHPSNGTGNRPVGAVLVVGGGIAGMQASLDLAEQGFKVYLAETKSAIGGHMAQLDKTFPTNDCAMCTISPKLVDVGRHLNIEILTDTEVLAVDGQAGNFTARVRRKPRYIDVDKCTACGECAAVCPIVIPGTFDEGMAQQRAAYKLYPQAVPNAYAIEKRGVAPCRDACPAGQRAQGYIALIREGRYAEAMRVIKEDNPFPGICGRICNHRCELACNRNLVDEPLNIHLLKRFVADWEYAREREPVKPVPHTHTRPQRIAVIGAGPCGLTAAKDLVERGYGATVFEALPVAGGMLRVGVPEYRLPSEIVDREVQDILDLGVDLRLNTRVDDLDDLLGDHEGDHESRPYDAVLVAVGAHVGKKLPIPGADLPDVLVNTNFLRDVRLAELETRNAVPGSEIRNPKSKIENRDVLILGGGNVAIDCARTAVRLGAASVSMACLETKETMPSHKWEVEAAEEEGVTVYPARSFTRILSDDQQRVTGVECLNVTFMEFDLEGRLTLETEPGSKHVIPCDTVIFSIGQRAGLAFIHDGAGVGITRQQTIAVNPDTFVTSRPGVFAAGDATTGTSFVIEAVASGHRAASAIHSYLSGEALEAEPELPVAKMMQPEIDRRVAEGDIRRAARVLTPMIPIAERQGSFTEVELGYTEDEARSEAGRCLACGVCSECLSCVYACGVHAINHDEVERIEELDVGAVILAPGYQAYNAQLSGEYGLGRFPNVVTSLQYERLLSASGPTKGQVRRPSDGVSPKRVAFLQCVGSRDQSHDYCSSVCCMYAAKEAIMTMEHARAEGHSDVSCQVFFMDTRAFSKGYEEYYRRAEQKYGVKYTRCRISELREDPQTRKLKVRYAAPYEGMPDVVEEEFDLVVLSVGMEISDSVKQLGRNLGIELDPYGFCHTTLFDPLQSSRPGIYVAGPFREPKDIPDTVIEASGAAASAAQMLASARYSLARVQDYPPERDVLGEEPRTGVFVCHCGSNIGGFLDVPGVAEFARTLPGVVHAEDKLYTCSQDSIAHIIEQVKALGLNRVVVAACTPLTHEPLFQDAIRQAGLNPYLFEMANIRNQCSWVHSGDWDGAAEKARALVRMAVARAARLEPLRTSEVPVNNTALIIGGGAAGMTAALTLAEQGFPAHIVERCGHLGGNLRNLRFWVPEFGREGSGRTGKQVEGYTGKQVDGYTGGAAAPAPSLSPDVPVSLPPDIPVSLPPDVPVSLSTCVPVYVSPQQYLEDIVSKVATHPLITVHLNTEFVRTGGFKGNFTSTLASDGNTFQVQHGVTIVATGGAEYKGPEYGYGTHPRIVTQLEFEGLLAEAGEQGGKRAREQISNHQLPISDLQSVVMIQCVGPAEKFCSRLCCTTALKNALKLKELEPDADVTVLYRDIRTYGFKERVYTEARRAGVRFVHFDFDRKPEVQIGKGASEQQSKTASEQVSSLQYPISNTQSPITVRVYDPTIGMELELHPDLVVLSMPVVPSKGTQELATRLKVPVEMDGFFLEAHVKLRPVDFASDGVFMAGLAHYPKFLDETVAQAKAAASRAASILSQERMVTSARVAVVDSARCTGCLTCVRVCPYNVPVISNAFTGVGNIVGAAYIEPAICHGCGTCVAECPAKAIQLLHYTDAQMLTKVDALFGREQPSPIFVPLESIRVVA